MHWKCVFKRTVGLVQLCLAVGGHIRQSTLQSSPKPARPWPPVEARGRCRDSRMERRGSMWVSRAGKGSWCFLGFFPPFFWVGSDAGWLPFRNRRSDGLPRQWKRLVANRALTVPSGIEVNGSQRASVLSPSLLLPGPVSVIMMLLA